MSILWDFSRLFKRYFSILSKLELIFSRFRSFLERFDDFDNVFLKYIKCVYFSLILSILSLSSIPLLMVPNCRIVSNDRVGLTFVNSRKIYVEFELIGAI